MPETSSAHSIRDRVVQIARHIEEMSQTDLPTGEYFPEFLRLVLDALGTATGAVWMLEDGGRIRLACEIGLAETPLASDPQARQRNQAIVAKALKTGQATTLGPGDVLDEVPLPTNHLLILGMIHAADGCAGVLEIFQRPDAPQAARAGYLQFVEQMCGHASDYLSRPHQNSRDEASPAGFWAELDRLSLNLQRSLNVREIALVAANDGRVFVGCDRLSVAYRRGRKTVIQAISGQDTVNARSNLCRAMRALVDEVMPTNQPLTYCGTPQDLPPRLERLLADFIQQSGSRMVMLIPLKVPDPLLPPGASGDTPAKRRQSGNRPPDVVGCLVAEQIADSRPVANLSRKMGLIADHAAAALANARVHQRVFLLPVWTLFGRALEWFHGRKLAKTAAILTAVAIVILSLIYVPWEYRVSGRGRLFPITRRLVFSPWDGDVLQVLVRGGQRVEMAQPLLTLHNDDLNTRLLTQRNALHEKQKAMISLQAEIDQAVRAADRKEETRLRGRLLETSVEADGLRQQIRILEKRIAALTVRSPITGVVATYQGDVEQLTKRPVQRGDSLLEVMDDTGTWHLELQVEGSRLGHILAGQRRLGRQDLPVEFIPATSPERSFTGRLQTIGTRTETTDNGANVVEIVVALDKERIPNLRIGAEVRAKIDCGTRSLGYVLFGDVIETIRRFLWL